MQRTTLSAIKAYAMPAFFTLIACIVQSFSLTMAKSVYLAGLHGPLWWVSFGLFGVGMLWFLLASYMMWRWVEGWDAACYCGGMLGFVRDGVGGRSDYRRCLGCGENHPVASCKD